MVLAEPTPQFISQLDTFSCNTSALTSKRALAAFDDRPLFPAALPSASQSLPCVCFVSKRAELLLEDTNVSKLFLRISIPALAAILALGQFSFAEPKPPPPPPKPPIIFPPIIFPPKPPVILPPPVVIVPPPVIVVPPAPPIVVLTPPAPPVIAADDPLLAGNDAAAMQTKKYLQITNNTGRRLQVFALYLGEDDKGQGMWLPADGAIGLVDETGARPAQRALAEHLRA